MAFILFKCNGKRKVALHKLFQDTIYNVTVLVLMEENLLIAQSYAGLPRIKSY